MIINSKRKKKGMELTSLCPTTQSKCTNVVDIQNNHIFEQCDAYPQDHTSYLTAGKKKKSMHE